MVEIRERERERERETETLDIIANACEWENVVSVFHLSRTLRRQQMCLN